MLEGGEERVQLRQRRALRRLQRLHRRHSPGEFALQWDGGKHDGRFGELFDVQRRLAHGSQLVGEIPLHEVGGEIGGHENAAGRFGEWDASNRPRDVEALHRFICQGDNTNRTDAAHKNFVTAKP